MATTTIEQLTGDTLERAGRSRAEHAEVVRTIGSAILAGRIPIDGARAAGEPRYYDGRSLWSWSRIGIEIWRHERGPDGQVLSDLRIA